MVYCSWYIFCWKKKINANLFKTAPIIQNKNQLISCFAIRILSKKILSTRFKNKSLAHCLIHFPLENAIRVSICLKTNISCRFRIVSRVMLKFWINSLGKWVFGIKSYHTYHDNWFSCTTFSPFIIIPRGKNVQYLLLGLYFPKNPYIYSHKYGLLIV